MSGVFSGDDVRYCHLCGRRIGGQFYEYPTGMTVCATCERTAPRCANCNAPTSAAGAVISRRGVLLCSRCAREVNSCGACGEPLLSAWSTFEELVATAEPRRYCPDCVAHRKRCDLCHAPLGAHTITLTDGQYRCQLCATELVVGEPAVRLVYTDALRELGRIVDQPLRQTPPLEIVSRRRMGATRLAHAHDAGLSARHSEDATGGAHVLGLFVRAHGKSLIFIEAGLTRGLLLGALAHELGHAWQTEQLGAAAGAVDPELGEGFAEWVAHHTLLANGRRILAQRARERQDIYGRGLIRLLSVEQARGRAAVLAIARAGRL